MRIVQISDIHHGLFLPQEWLSEAVRQANRLNPDVIALTGDFITYSRRNIVPAAVLMGRLRARYGVYAVLGNHDFRVDADAVTSALGRQRIEVLRNRHVSLWFGGESVYLAGVDDYGYGADLRRAMRGVPREAASILLAHNPRLIGLASRNGVSLVLSGHTHGGQVNLPLLGTVYGRSPEFALRLAGTVWAKRKFMSAAVLARLFAVEAALPRGNHPPGIAAGRIGRFPIGCRGLIPQTHAHR